MFHAIIRGSLLAERTIRNRQHDDQNYHDTSLTTGAMSILWRPFSLAVWGGHAASLRHGRGARRRSAVRSVLMTWGAGGRPIQYRVSD